MEFFVVTIFGRTEQPKDRVERFAQRQRSGDILARQRTRGHEHESLVVHVEDFACHLSSTERGSAVERVHEGHGLDAALVQFAS